MNLTLITGASGFLGKYIVASFKKRGFDYLTLGRSVSNEVICDLSKDSPVFSQPFETVIHCAALAHSYPKSVAEEKLFYNSHVVATENLLKSLVSFNCGKFVFISSVAVYGQETGKGIGENFPPAPSTVYGRCKLLAENIIVEWGKKHEVPVYILRLPLVVGENPPGNLGAMIRAILKKYYVCIRDVNPRKSMVLATDVADLLSSGQLLKPGIYNLTDGYDPKMRELEACIYKKFQLSSKPYCLPFFIVRIVAKIGDLLSLNVINSSKIKKLSSDLTFDDHKARLAINWKPQKVIDGW